MSELKAISGNEIREDIDYNTRGIDPEDKEWRNYGKELCDTLYYIKSEADKVIAEKDKEIAELKVMAKEPSVPNRTCRKCGRVGTLMYMPIVKNERMYWDLYNNKGVDYVFGIQCAHCGEVAFVTKQTYEYELCHQKYKRCLAMAEICNAMYDKEDANVNRGMASWDYTSKEMKYWERWRNRWLAIAEKL